MKRQIPLAVKFSLSFVALIVLAVALIYLLTTWSIARQFNQYQRINRESFAEIIAAQLGNHREQNGTWDGAPEAVLRQSYIITLGDQSLEGSVPLIDVPYALFYGDGRFFVASTRDPDWVRSLLETHEDGSVRLVHDWQDRDDLGHVTPIRVNGELVGTFIVGQIGDSDIYGTAFIKTAAQSTLIGGGIAIGVALFLSTILIIQILRPLRALSGVTEQVAAGDTPNEVVVRTHDELGRLGSSFNHMLESLKRSESARQAMTADIAHELRTPVTIIQGTLEALLDGIYDPTEETLAPIYEETLHLGRLIDDLRDLALAEAGELHLEKEPIDVDELIRQVSETAFLSREDAPALHIDIVDRLPIIPLDEKRFRQVIANLLSNAIRHTPTDGEVIIRARYYGSFFEMSVLDSGPGIRPEDLPHLFERFYRGDPSRRRSAGSGLGLAIVKQWVEAHDGTITAQNREIGGARFLVRLPIQS